MPTPDAMLRLFVLWLSMLPLAVQAQSFVESIVGIDYASALTAAVIAMTASVISSSLHLLSPTPVEDTGRSFLLDTIYGFLAGGFAWLVIEVMRETDYWSPKRMTWMLIILAAGVLRVRLFAWAGELGRDVAKEARERVLRKVRGVSNEP